MASSINTTNINTAYPVAGVDNDSQGFRDNFKNTNDNFIAAKSEIEDLQNKAILKSALTGGTLDNDMSGALIKNAKTQGFRETVKSIGTTSGSVSIVVSDAPYQTLTTSGAVTLAFTGFPSSGSRSVVRVEIAIADVSHTVTLPAEVTIGVDGIQNIDTNVITFKSIGTYILEFSTTDQGTTIALNDLTQGRLANQILLVSAPASTVGASGDLAGMIAFDASYIYLCTADYDGVSNIWIRASAATW